MIILPTQKVPASSTNPSFLILYGRPKSGKTSCLAQLDNNLIVDLEGGSTFIEALAVQARSVNDLGEIAQAVRAKNSEVGHNFYKHITIDNATRLEEICLPYAATLYRQTPIAKNWKGTDVRTLPNGSGYFYIRQAVRKVIDMFRELCDEFILVGHVKDVQVDQNGEELSEMALDLVGKLSSIICGEADAVGYLYRKGNETHISFKGGDGTIKEARAPHLRGKDIIIATGNEDGTITTDWKQIYK
ncbi:RecA protein [uncultured phage cr130_1]|uniref:RecA protein n=1 Tax=uncultured phage cr130_1 TaxID=2772092 RepID=A0A7M1RT60_9CAUD|nr:RecA protein [uncultured phage cr130_1]QOR57617.1 RecA protein [uncultured phage cr130_1]